MISRRPRQNKIDAKNAEIAEADKEIKATESFIEAITATRVQENDDFKKAKEKDQQAIALLVQVRDVMSEFYKSETGGFGDIQGSVKGASLAQKKKQPEFAVSAFDAPEATFSKVDKRENEAKGIVQILTMVIEDLNDEIANSMKTEEVSQKTFEAQKFSAEMLIAKLKAKIVFLDGVIAKTLEEQTEEKATLAKNDGLHGDETDYLNGILPACRRSYGRDGGPDPGQGVPRRVQPGPGVCRFHQGQAAGRRFRAGAAEVRRRGDVQAHLRPAP